MHKKQAKPSTAITTINSQQHRSKAGVYFSCSALTPVSAHSLRSLPSPTTTFSTILPPSGPSLAPVARHPHEITAPLCYMHFLCALSISVSSNWKYVFGFSISGLAFIPIFAVPFIFARCSLASQHFFRLGARLPSAEVFRRISLLARSVLWVPWFRCVVHVCGVLVRSFFYTFCVRCYCCCDNIYLFRSCRLLPHIFRLTCAV